MVVKRNKSGDSRDHVGPHATATLRRAIAGKFNHGEYRRSNRNALLSRLISSERSSVGRLLLIA